MLNMMKADIQRIFRGKGIYITLAILLAFTVMHAVGVSSAGDTTLRYAGADMPFYLMFISDNVLYFMAFIIIYIAADDFCNGTIKNVLSNGLPRVQYYVSKLLLSFVFCILLFGVHIIGGTIIATIVHGFGGTFDMDFVLSVLQPASAQLFVLLSVTCVGIFFAFATKNANATITCYLSFIMLPLIIIPMLMGMNERFERLLDFELVTNIRAFVSFAELSSGEITRIFLIAAGYMLLSTIAGIMLFRKCEIK